MFRIDWSDYAQAIPAFATIVLMPLTYSIAYGIIGGLLTYACINIPVYLIDVGLGQKTWPPQVRHAKNDVAIAPFVLVFLALYRVGNIGCN